MARFTGLTISGVALLLLFTGCQSGQYDDRYVYQPRPMTVETFSRERPDLGTVRTLVSVVGLRRADEDADLPASVHVRMRLDNTADSIATFDPSTITLFGADVRQFAPPILDPAQVLTLEPGDSATVDAYFPLRGEGTPGTVSLEGLGVRWTVDIAGDTVPGSATFSRRERDYYRRYNDPRFNFGFGYGYHRW
ncbi:MAG: hypothetical protein WD294_04325 [Phycisphaeraceae bacterium]